MTVHGPLTQRAGLQCTELTGVGVSLGGGAQDTVYSAQIQSIFWKGWSFNSVYRHTFLTFPGEAGLGCRTAQL